MRLWSGAEGRQLAKWEREQRERWQEFLDGLAEEVAENLAGPTFSREYIRERIVTEGSIKGRKVA